MTLRIAFLGTPEVAVPTLRELASADGIDADVVITNPDRPAGRGRRPTPPPVRLAAQQLGLDVWQPDRIASVVDGLAGRSLDAAAVVAYGSLLPPAVLATTRLGFVNLHFSLLPRWRGAAPVQHAIRAGDSTTGVTTFVIDEGMDTGPVIGQQAVAIGEDEDAGTLAERLASRGAPLMVHALRFLDAGGRPTPQPGEGVTLAPRIGTSDLPIRWVRPAEEVHRHVRSVSPRPGARTRFRDRMLVILGASPLPSRDRAGSCVPGEILDVVGEGIVVACGEGALVVSQVKPEGRNAMDAVAFAHGQHPVRGEILGGDPTG